MELSVAEQCCVSCEQRKAKMNPAKGVLIPGGYGKCTREGGLCGHFLNTARIADGMAGQESEGTFMEMMAGDGHDTDGVNSLPVVPAGAADGAALTLVERDLLEDLERTISGTMTAAFLKVGEALTQIRDARLYRDRFDTFEAYCAARWELSRSRAYQLMDAAAVYARVHLCGHAILPMMEAHVRPLVRVEAEHQAEVWCEAVASAPGGVVTGPIVAAAVRRHLGEQVARRAGAARDGADSDPELPEEFKTHFFAMLDVVRANRATCGKALRTHLENLLRLLED